MSEVDAFQQRRRRMTSASAANGSTMTAQSMKPSLSGGGVAGAVPRSTVNQRAALVSAYNELGKELASTKLKAVGNYTLGRTIGEGTFGKVRMGTHRLLGTRVAIKQVPKAHSASLTREIHHHRRLHHFHVMKLFEVLATESNIWMISELCLGGELYDYLVERGTLPEAEARRIFGQLCLAVAYVHRQGIVHRDLKLENILLDEHCNVKLGDFGFTREFEGKRLMETFCGTTGYAAPEMLAGKRYTGEEVDIWSLGIILYALLYGSLPFDDDDESVMKSKILQGDFELPDFISEEARDLLGQILRLDPTQRLSIKAILSHPWFSKTIVATPMATVDEQRGGDYFPSPLKRSSELLQGDKNKGMTAMTALDSKCVHDSSERGLGVDLGTDAAASLSHVEDVERRPSGSTSEDEASSDQQSSVSTGQTSLTDSGKSSVKSQGADDASGDKTLTSDVLTEVDSRKPMGMQQRNSSQTTIRKDSSNELTRPGASAVTATSVRSLATHHESAPDSVKPAPTSAPASPNVGGRNRIWADGASLVKRDSQSSSRGHHRTPSRTKRRSLSASGLSDHHPPHLTNKPVNFCAMLEEQQPALFSTSLEQDLLHQLGNLGMDVGQMVHSILTDACDASAAMWWILKQKHQSRNRTQTRTHHTSSTAAKTGEAVVPLESLSTLAAPPLPPKDPLRAASGSSVPHRIPSSTRTEGLPQSAQDSFRRHVHPPAVFAKQHIANSATLPQGYDKQPHSTSVGEFIASIDTTSLKRSVEASQDPDSPSLPTVDPGSPHSYTGPFATSSAAGTKTGRPKTNRDRTNSLSMKLAGVLSTWKETAAPDLSKPLVADDDVDRIALSPRGVSGFFMRKASGGASLAKPAKDDQLCDPAVLQTPPRKPMDSVPSLLTTSTHPTSFEEIRKISTSSDKLRSPSKSTTSKTAPSQALDATEVGGSLTSSQSMDTFTTVSSLTNDESRPGAPKAKDSAVASKAKNKSSAFMTTVRMWLGTEEKQARRKNKKKASNPTQAAVPNHADASTVMQRKRSRSSYHASSVSAGVGSLNRRHPRTPSIKSPTSSRLSYAYPSSDLSYTGAQRPNPLRRQSAGSITPTAVYGTTPSRAPSTNSLYRTQGPPSASHHARPLSVSSNQSGIRGSYHHQHPSDSSGVPAPTSINGSVRGLKGRRMSSDGGTVVLRQRVHQRPRSESSRPTSLIDVGDRAFDADESMVAPSMVGGDSRSGAGTPRRLSIDSRREVESCRASPVATHSVFVAHRTRTSYKPPSANPALFSRRSSSLSADGTSSGGSGTWRSSWGRPPPLWAGPVDKSSTSFSHDPFQHGAGSSRSDLHGGERQIRDVFSRKFSADEDEWEDEEESPVFSGGLGQLDSNGNASFNGETPTRPGPHSALLSMQQSDRSEQQQHSPVLNNGSYSSFGRWDNRSGSGLVDNGGQRPSAFSSRYAGVRSAFYHPPALGRDTAPRMISVTEGGDEEADDDEGSQQKEGTPSVPALLGQDPPLPVPTATDDSRSPSGVMSPASRLRSGAMSSAFHAVTEEEEEEE